MDCQDLKEKHYILNLALSKLDMCLQYLNIIKVENKTVFENPVHSTENILLHFYWITGHLETDS